MKTFLYKLSKSVIPCMLITLCIGFCYAWSLFAPGIREVIPGTTASQVQFAFCLNIFFLGMGAAFFGPLVEKNIKEAAIISSLLLFIGLQVAAYGVAHQSLWLVYLGFGTIAGLSEGCGYVVPVKNLLLWWGKTRHKGVVAALSIIFFGLGSTMCSWLFGIMTTKFNYGVSSILSCLSIIYGISMALGCILIDKPAYAKRQLHANASAGCKISNASLSDLVKDPFFRRSWLFMFLNISMGLVLIGTCASLLKDVAFLKPEAIIAVMMVCGIANGAGRLVFPFISDFMSKRLWIWMTLLFIEVAILMPAAFVPAMMLPVAVIIINATYGAAFSTLPTVLYDHYGKDNLSKIHGLVLSAWAFASLFAYLVTSLGIGHMPFIMLVCVLGAAYMFNIGVVKGMFKLKEK